MPSAPPTFISSFANIIVDSVVESFVIPAAQGVTGRSHRAQVISLALSMLQSNDAEKRIYPVLGPLLVEEIGYDYTPPWVPDSK